MRYLALPLAAALLSAALPPQAAAETPLRVTQDIVEAEDGLVDIPKAEWFDMVRGRTVIYKIGPDVWAFETYATTGNYVAIQLADGSCMDGTWEHVDGAFCFAWESREYSCFRHARDGEEILIIPVVDGVQSGTTQLVSGISDAPITCGPDLVS